MDPIERAQERAQDLDAIAHLLDIAIDRADEVLVGLGNLAEELRGMRRGTLSRQTKPLLTELQAEFRAAKTKAQRTLDKIRKEAAEAEAEAQELQDELGEDEEYEDVEDEDEDEDE